MASRKQTRRANDGLNLTGLLLLAAILFGHGLPALAQDSASSTSASSLVLDRVIAVVNNQAILASDLDMEQRIARLLPLTEGGSDSPPQALERLTTRALIVQQIQLEDPKGLEVSDSDLAAGLAELRQTIPGCRTRDCASPAGWADYLATLGLMPDSVEAYWRSRIAVLRFIERRFRSGNQVAQEEIDKYYQDTFVPAYAKSGDAPPLKQVSQRIEEILLQQKVNALLNDWLKSLQQQGEVEILDPALRAAVPDPKATDVAPAVADPALVATPAKTGGRP